MPALISECNPSAGDHSAILIQGISWPLVIRDLAVMAVIAAVLSQ